MTNFNLTYKPFGERSILIEWPNKIAVEVLYDVISFRNHLIDLDIKQIVDINSSYNSILVSYNVTIEDFYSEFSYLKDTYSSRKTKLVTKFKRWKIPVCYDVQYGIDLVELSERTQLSIHQTIELHSSSQYTIYALGFLPGFLYLGGLDTKLHVPRRDAPRLKINKGDVGIGGRQTGIYPSDSPGGWQIIGNSPLTIFDPSAEVPCFAQAGDEVSFYPISLEEHKKVKDLVNTGGYKLEYELIYD